MVSEKDSEFTFIEEKAGVRSSGSIHIHELIIFTITSLHYLVVHTILTTALYKVVQKNTAVLSSQLCQNNESSPHKNIGKL